MEEADNPATATEMKLLPSSEAVDNTADIQNQNGEAKHIHTENNTQGDTVTMEALDDGTVEPPDGGWGWVVLFGSFMVHLIYDGLMYCSGVILSDIRIHFDVGRTEIGWIASILTFITYAPGTFYGMMLDRLGCKIVGIAGALTVSVSLVISAYSNSMWLLCVTFGVTAGIGFGNMYMSAIVAISLNFKKKLSMATGFAICGSGIGILTIAPLNNWLLSLFSWRGTLLINAALVLQCCIFSALFRPLAKKRISKSAVDVERKMLETKSDKIPDVVVVKKSKSKMANYGKLMKSPALHMIAACHMCAGFAGYMPYIFMPDMVTTNGHSAEKGALALSVMGIGNMAGRGGIMWILDRPCVNKLYATVAVAFVQGASILMMPIFASVYPLLIMDTVIFGAMYGVSIGMCSVLLVGLFDNENIAFSLGYVTTTTSFAYLLGPVVTGFLYDTFGNYRVPYFGLGSLVMLGGVFLWLIVFTPEYKTRMRKNST